MCLWILKLKVLNINDYLWPCAGLCLCLLQLWCIFIAITINLMDLNQKKILYVQLPFWVSGNYISDWLFRVTASDR